MEIFPYLIDVIMFGFACYWSAANMARDPGTPTFGLFRYRETRKKEADVKPAAAALAKLRR